MPMSRLYLFYSCKGDTKNLTTFDWLDPNMQTKVDLLRKKAICVTGLDDCDANTSYSCIFCFKFSEKIST